MKVDDKVFNDLSVCFANIVNVTDRFTGMLGVNDNAMTVSYGMDQLSDTEMLLAHIISTLEDAEEE